MFQISRIHGRNGVAYVSVDPIGGANPVASPMAFLSDWSISFTVAKVDVTAMLDTNLIYVAGLPDASGDFSGFYDTSTAQTYVSAVDGLPRNFYLYPSNLAAQMSPVPQYFFGTVLPDYSLAGGVTAAVSLKSTWNAASKISRYPVYGLPGT